MKLHRKFPLSPICRNCLQHRCVYSGLCAVFRRPSQANRTDRQRQRERENRAEQNTPQHATNRKLWLGTVISCLHCILPLILISLVLRSHLPACYQDKQWRQTWCSYNSSLFHGFFIEYWWKWPIENSRKILLHVPWIDSGVQKQETYVKDS